jgi:hypothetical protein
MKEATARKNIELYHRLESDRSFQKRKIIEGSSEILSGHYHSYTSKFARMHTMSKSDRSNFSN